ncbi:MAG: response regulator [Planctomycetota bacterium]
MTSVLLIEDDREIAATLGGALRSAGYDLRHAPNGIKGQELYADRRPDLIVTDMMMPQRGGFPVLEFLATQADPPPAIMVTANEGGRHKAYAEMLGVVDYLRKPFAMDVLLEAAEKALDAYPPGSPGPKARRETAEADGGATDEEE